MRPGGEHPAQDRGNLLRFAIDLLFAEADNLQPKGPQLQIAAPVVPKGLAPAVIAVAIGFDDQTALAPEEVDQVGPDANVDLGIRQSLTLADPQEIPLEITAGAIVEHVLPSRQSQHICLSNRLAQLPLWNCPTKIGNRPGWRGNRDPVASCGVLSRERGDAMQTNSLSLLPASTHEYRDVDRPRDRLEQPPKLSSASVTYRRPLPIGEGGCHPPSAVRECGVADRVDAAVHPVQAPSVDPSTHRTTRDPRPVKLGQRDHSMLLSGNFRHTHVWTGDFCTHMAHKSP